MLKKLWAWIKSFKTKKPAKPTTPPQLPPPTPVAYPKGWHQAYSDVVLAFEGKLPKLPASRVAFFRALATAESNLDPKTVYKEPASIGGMLSIGLLQLSLNDVKNYKQQALGITTEDDLKDPIKNLKLGMAILSHLHLRNESENVYQVGGLYWSVLRWNRYWPDFRQDGFERFTKALGSAPEVDANSPDPITPPEPKGSEPAWLTIARKELGTKEIPGPRHNNRILEYHDATTLDADDEGTAWCSSFCNWVMQKAGFKGTRSAAARSWLGWGKVVSKPMPGDIVVFWRGSKDGWMGHVAFYLSHDKNYITVLGGNQSNAVTVAKYPASQLLGYRRPE
jgi:uncharacterized protein (TIGR02594 family)